MGDFQRDESQHGVWSRARIAILGPFPPRPGGVSVQCATLAEALEQQGARVVRLNTDVPRWRGHGWRRGAFPLVQIAHVMQALRSTREQWDILHVHAASWWGFMPAVLGLMAGRWGKRLVVTYHGGEAATFMARYGRFARSILGRYHVLLTLTPTQADIFRSYGLKPQIIPNIIPLDRFHFRPRGPLVPNILWLRHFEPRYRPQDALAVFSRILHTYPRASMTMVGGGKLLEAIQAQAKSEGLSNITFTGPLSMHSLPAQYDKADIFLNTSAVDNLPLSLIEASASGLPIVSTNAGAIPDLIQHGENGLLAPVGDVEALADAILKLLDDAALARRLSLAARENAARFSQQHVMAQLARVYGLTAT